MHIYKKKKKKTKTTSAPIMIEPRSIEDMRVMWLTSVDYVHSSTTAVSRVNTELLSPYSN
jgi:hypothetical protein